MSSSSASAATAAPPSTIAQHAASLCLVRALTTGHHAICKIITSTMQSLRCSSAAQQPQCARYHVKCHPSALITPYRTTCWALFVKGVTHWSLGFKQCSDGGRWPVDGRAQRRGGAWQSEAVHQTQAWSNPCVHTVAGIERFTVAHDQGSSHGLSRIIRLAYWEHPDYVPLLRRAYELWRRLEEETHMVSAPYTGRCSAAYRKAVEAGFGQGRSSGSGGACQLPRLQLHVRTVVTETLLLMAFCNQSHEAHRCLRRNRWSHCLQDCGSFMVRVWSEVRLGSAWAQVCSQPPRARFRLH